MVVGPNTFGALGVSVDVKIPKPITQALKQLPEVRQELRQYATTAAGQSSKAIEVTNALNVTAQTLGVALVFGGIIVALLMREGRSKRT